MNRTKSFIVSVSKGLKEDTITPQYEYMRLFSVIAENKNEAILKALRLAGISHKEDFEVRVV